jgi:hypothetical protein
MRISASVRVWEVLRGTVEPLHSVRRTRRSEVTNDLVGAGSREQGAGSREQGAGAGGWEMVAGNHFSETGGLPLRMLLILLDGLSLEPPMRLPSDYAGMPGGRAG